MEEKAQDKAEETEAHSFTHSGIPQKHQTGTHNVKHRGQVLTNAGPGYSPSVFENSVTNSCWLQYIILDI